MAKLEILVRHLIAQMWFQGIVVVETVAWSGRVLDSLVSEFLQQANITIHIIQSIYYPYIVLGNVVNVYDISLYFTVFNVFSGDGLMLE